MVALRIGRGVEIKVLTKLKLFFNAFSGIELIDKSGLRPISIEIQNNALRF